MKLSRVFPAAMCVLAVACSDDGPMTAPDAEVPDMGMMIVDSGVRATCPLAANNPTCNFVEECFDPNEEFRTDDRCAFCPQYKPDRLCSTGQCAGVNGIGGVINLNVEVGALIAELNFLARLVVDAETSGGLTLSCAEVMQNPTAFFEQPCYNITDLRTGPTSGQVGTTFALPFSGTQAGRDVIFVVYGFAEDNGDGTPIGISCTEYTVPADVPQGMRVEVGATNMTRIQ